MSNKQAIPAYNPKTHVFDYGGTLPTEERELYVLEEFGKRMQSCHRASFKLVCVSDALRGGLVVQVDGSTVDGVLATAKGPVAVELLGYSPIRDRGDMMARDLKLREQIQFSLYDLLKKKLYSLSLRYRSQPRPGAHGGTVCMVPRRQDFEAFIKEIRFAVTNAPLLEFCEFLWLNFVSEPESAAAWSHGSNSIYLNESKFPMCATHLSNIRLQGMNEHIDPKVDSDLRCGHIGIDDNWLCEHLIRKAGKSLNQSRQRANGLPLWLIVHSDGRPINRRIPETHRSRAVKVCRETLTATEHGFARVYWADQTGFCDAAWVGRVL